MVGIQLRHINIKYSLFEKNVKHCQEVIKNVIDITIIEFFNQIVETRLPINFCMAVKQYIQTGIRKFQGIWYSNQI